MRHIILCALLVLFLGKTAIATETDQPIPRVIYTFYERAAEDMPRFSLVHRALEMPLNWLGYHLEYIEINDTLPPWRKDIAGVVLWNNPGSVIPNTKQYLNWLEDGLRQKKKLIILGNMGIGAEYLDTPEGMNHTNRVLAYIGLKLENAWTELTYNTNIIHKNPRMVEYERTYKGTLPSYHVSKALKGATSHLKAQSVTEDGSSVTADLVTTHNNGGYVAENYSFYYKERTDSEDEGALQRWMIDPFAFITTIFADNPFPKPDVTTLNGRRIFYSHLDGDGWNNYSEIKKYAAQRMLSSEVLLHEIYIPYKQLPFTVAPIVSDLEPDCYGVPNSKKTAVKIFALSNVEPASHTHSHPLLWRFFEEYDPEQERPFLDDYPPRPGNQKSVYDALSSLISSDVDNKESWADALRHQHGKASQKKAGTMWSKEEIKKNFNTPRSYSCEPFDIEQEIGGSVAYMQALAPKHKKVKLLQWSGDTTPAENALAEARKKGILNINGGDSRFDPEYPSYSYVAPIGLNVGKERQIYSSNSNENTYTNLWSSRFFGFRHLVSTARNTETPRRVSPFNIYYHTYSAEKQASLEALKQNLGYALAQDIIPIYTSHYAEIANGFFSTTLTPLAQDRWRVENRGALQTLRFDHGTLKAVDWERSEGVIGQRHYQGSLYIFLNPDHLAPIIALKNMEQLLLPPKALHPYIIESRWPIHNMQYTRDTLTLSAEGFGDGVMQFYWPKLENLRVTVMQEDATLINEVISVKKTHEVKLAIHSETVKPVTITITKE